MRRDVTMLEIINSNVVENLDDIYNRYPKCMILVQDMYDNCRGTTTAKIYAVSRSDSSYLELCDLNRRMHSEGCNTSILGDYEEGFILNVQYFN